jgi:para-aminobenzoate synthetase / 4-amino-4-deoxychorismate lyase
MAVVFDRPRPNPQLGVFETLLVAGGRPVELDAHLARLAASLTELFPGDETPRLAEEIEARAQDIELGSARVTVAPPSRVAIAVRSLPPGDFLSPGEKDAAGPPVALATLALGGGLGAHKWADRSLLDAAQAQMPTGALPLLVDRDGAVLEASRASVFAVRDGALFTPPLDGRILPGITRARVLAIAVAAGLETHETELSLEDLLTADEVFLTGSVRGVERVGAIDGCELATAGDVTASIATELRRTWIDGRLG